MGLVKIPADPQLICPLLLCSDGWSGSSLVVAVASPGQYHVTGGSNGVVKSLLWLPFCQIKGLAESLAAGLGKVARWVWCPIRFEVMSCLGEMARWVWCPTRFEMIG